VLDTQLQQAVFRLAGNHGGAVVGHQAARQASLVKGLRQAVDKRFGGFVKVPLNMAAEPGTVVEDA